MKRGKDTLYGAVILALMVFLSGCYSSYVTPAGANMGIFRGAFTESGSVRPNGTPRPAASFPVTLAVARIQGAGYYQADLGYCVVNAPLSGTQGVRNGFGQLPGIARVVPVNKLLMAGYQKSPDALRQAAASLKAQMLYLYTLDSVQDEADWSSAVSLYTLGLAPTVKVEVTTTAMGMLIDTQTGYVYGVLEASAVKEQAAAYMTRQNAWDQCRNVTEALALEDMNRQFPVMWNEVLSRYGQAMPNAADAAPAPLGRLEKTADSGGDAVLTRTPAEQQFWK